MGGVLSCQVSSPMLVPLWPSIRALLGLRFARDLRSSLSLIRWLFNSRLVDILTVLAIDLLGRKYMFQRPPADEDTLSLEGGFILGKREVHLEQSRLSYRT